MKAGSVYLQLIVTVKVESAKLHEVVEHWSYLQYRFVYHYVLCLIYCQQYTVYIKHVHVAYSQTNLYALPRQTWLRTVTEDLCSQNNYTAEMSMIRFVGLCSFLQTY